AKARGEFMDANPTLMVDTAHFGAEFKDNLLAQFDDIDGDCDGVLLSGENFQGLNLLAEKYRGRVDCVHIDPPYNTNTSGFLYKNGYQHSSWMTMMENRNRLAQDFLSEKGTFLCHIDENEYERLRLLMDNLSLLDAGTVIWDKKNPMMGAKGIAVQHEYILWRTRHEGSFYLQNKNPQSILAKAKKIIAEHGGVNDSAKKAFQKWIDNNKNLAGGESSYRFLDDDGRVYQSVALVWPNPSTPPDKFFIPLIHPVTKKPCPVPPKGWSRSPEKMQELLNRNEIIFGKDHTVQPRRKLFLSQETKRAVSTVIQNGKRGQTEIENLGLEFSYCHPTSLYETLINAALTDSGRVALDFFAGSGTTGHAVINLNREDGGRRKFILMEMGEYFDSVLLPRLKKVAWTPEWKDGKPRRAATEVEVARAPRMFKVQRLESYEDALDNIAFTGEDRAQRMMKFPDYLLGYMLKWETRGSQTLLNVANLEAPFAYELRVRRNGDHSNTRVDVAETFNYLLGLHVQTRKIYTDKKRRYLVYTGQVGGRAATVIWRDTQGWDVADFEREREFVAKNKFAKGVDLVYVNGNSVIPGALSLDPIFKKSMIAGAET
ncbi:MAG: site-specific DNA-methyltransferase, partial [Gammaproteobacteria bacterium]|nr:site-specific DNA-methyltransferase [Gammaproteobacteria bacterium]